MKIAVTGANGQLGSVLSTKLEAAGHKVVRWDLPEFDITDSARVIRGLEDVRPEIVYHCAAMTHVDGCESSQAQTYLVNTLGTRNILRGLSRFSGRMVFISTDYVFDGRSQTGYSELDLPNPQSIYGKSKFFAEQAVLSASLDHLVVRISWLFGPGGFANFVRTIHGLAESGSPLQIVGDQRGIPTYAPFLADNLVSLCDLDAHGIVHLPGGTESVSWYEFGEALIEASGISRETVDLSPCTTEEFPRPAPRPANSTLRSIAREKLGIPEQRSWREGLADYFAQLKA